MFSVYKMNAICFHYSSEVGSFSRSLAIYTGGSMGNKPVTNFPARSLYCYKSHHIVGISDTVRKSKFDKDSFKDLENNLIIT